MRTRLKVLIETPDGAMANEFHLLSPEAVQCAVEELIQTGLPQLLPDHAGKPIPVKVTVTCTKTTKGKTHE